MRSADEQILQVAIILFVGVMTLVGTLVIVLIFRDWILRKLLGRTEVALDDVAGALVRAVSAASAGDREAATTHAQAFVQSGIGWYTWSNFYRWVFNTALALLVAFGAFWGTVLLFEQTRTLRVQTDRIADQTELMSSQTKLMEAQTARLEEQTLAAVIQNEILTVSLVGELRDQILSTTQEVDFFELLRGSDGYFDKDLELVRARSGACRLNLDDPGPLTRPPGGGTIRALAKLARSGRLAPQVREALDFLTEDNNGAVALTAVRVLDEIGGTKTYELSNIERMLLEEWEIRQPHDFYISGSVVSDLTCPDCKVILSDSFVFYETISPEDAGTPTIFDSLVNRELDMLTGAQITSSLILPAAEEVPSFHTLFEVRSDMVEDFGALAQFSAGAEPCDLLQQFARSNRFFAYEALSPEAPQPVDAAPQPSE